MLKVDKFNYKLPALVYSTLFLSLFSVSCNQFAGRWSDSKDPFSPLSANEAAVKLNYAYVKVNILDTYCTNCHGNQGGINLESPESIRKHLQEIMAVMADRSMPRPSSTITSTMTDVDRQVLFNWAKAGAPAGTGKIIPLYPPLSPEDAAKKLNYAYVQTNILIPRCISCHGTDGKVSLEDIGNIRANSTKILNTVAGSKSMPKGRAGKKMTEDERSVLYNWMLAGAPVGDDPVPSPYDPIAKNPVIPVSDARMNFNYIRDNLFIPKCISCHSGAKASGKLDLSDFTAVQNRSRDILFAVVSSVPSMPPFGALTYGWAPTPQKPNPPDIPSRRVISPDEMELLYSWLSQGAPQGGAIVPIPATQPTFADIDAKIFQVRCMDCHDQTLPGKHPVALTQEALTNPKFDYVVGQDPEHSSLIISLEQTTANDPDPDPQPMPPSKKGYSMLSDEDLNTIKAWINTLPAPGHAPVPAPAPAPSPTTPSPTVPKPGGN